MSGEVEVIVEDGQTPCEPVASHTSLDMRFSHFNPLQSRFVLERLHTRDVNILSAWPTSTGKTVVVELTMEVALLIRNLIRKEKLAKSRILITR